MAAAKLSVVLGEESLGQGQGDHFLVAGVDSEVSRYIYSIYYLHGYMYIIYFPEDPPLRRPRPVEALQSGVHEHLHSARPPYTGQASGFIQKRVKSKLLH